MITLKDHDIKDKFSRTYGIDIKFSENNCDFLTIYDGQFPRKVVLDVTTWKGMTPGALHYYGCLKISSLKCQDLSSGKINYLTAKAPFEAKGLTIELTRPLLRKDLLIDDGQRFKGARPGERIKNFDTSKQVESAAIEFFNDHFLDGWNLVRLKPVQTMSFGGASIINNEVILSDHHVAV